MKTIYHLLSLSGLIFKASKMKRLAGTVLFPKLEKGAHIHSLEIKGFYILFTISNQTLQIFYIPSNYYMNSDFSIGTV